MSNVFVSVMSHPLTVDQKLDVAKFATRTVELVDNKLIDKWKNIDPIESVRSVGNEIIDFILENTDGCAANEVTILVQGESRVSFYIVGNLIKKGVRVVVATTKREVVEEVQKDGSILKKSIFKHIGFMPYEV